MGIMKFTGLTSVLVAGTALANVAMADAAGNGITASVKPVTSQSLQVRERIRSIEQIKVSAEKEAAAEAPESDRVKALLEEATQIEVQVDQSAEQ